MIVAVDLLFGFDSGHFRAIHAQSYRLFHLVENRRLHFPAIQICLATFVTAQRLPTFPGLIEIEVMKLVETGLQRPHSNGNVPLLAIDHQLHVSLDLPTQGLSRMENEFKIQNW